MADSSFLPSVGAVGPALTVMANAIRVASTWSTGSAEAGPRE
jgi:choline dehydrogenase-like flavoprotein